MHYLGVIEKLFWGNLRVYLRCYLGATWGGKKEGYLEITLVRGYLRTIWGVTIANLEDYIRKFKVKPCLKGYVWAI